VVLTANSSNLKGTIKGSQQGFEGKGGLASSSLTLVDRYCGLAKILLLNHVTTSTNVEKICLWIALSRC
jgi:hypothetical protein